MLYEMTFDALAIIARRHNSFQEYCADPKRNELRDEFLAVAKVRYGDGYVEQVSADQFLRFAAYAYDSINPGEVWKSFYLLQPHGEKKLAAYTLAGETPEEEYATMSQLAAENACDVKDIKIRFTAK